MECLFCRHLGVSVVYFGAAIGHHVLLGRNWSLSSLNAQRLLLSAAAAAGSGECI